MLNLDAGLEGLSLIISRINPPGAEASEPGELLLDPQYERVVAASGYMTLYVLREDSSFQNTVEVHQYSSRPVLADESWAGSWGDLCPG